MKVIYARMVAGVYQFSFDVTFETVLQSETIPRRDRRHKQVRYDGQTYPLQWIDKPPNRPREYKNLGHNQEQLLKFLQRHPNQWHSIHRASWQEARSLAKRGAIMFDELTGQARIDT